MPLTIDTMPEPDSVFNTNGLNFEDTSVERQLYQELLSEMVEDIWKYHILAHAAVSLVSSAIQKGVDIAKSIHDKYRKSEALLGIVESLKDKDISGSLVLARSIPDRTKKEEALRLIAPRKVHSK